MSEENTRKPFLDLSLTQLIGGSAAAATAAALGSRLGLVGTILGAAFVSVLTAVGGAVYTQSLRRTQEMIRARELIGARELMTRVGQRTSSQPTVRASARESGVEQDGEPERAPQDDGMGASSPPSLWTRVTWKTVAITAAVVFVIAGVAITGAELLTGKSLDGSKGTTVSNVVRGGGSGRSDNSPSKAPTPTPPTSRPSGSGSSVPTRSPSQTSSPSLTPSPTPSSTPTGGPSSTASPTAGSSGAAGSAASATPTP